MAKKVLPSLNVRAGTSDVSGHLNVKTTYTYPHSDKYNYSTKLVRLDMDQTRINDLKSGPNFIISAPKGIKNDVKFQNGIFSQRF